LKIAFVNQPWTVAAHPRGSDSTGIWSYQVCCQLVKSGETFFYGQKTNITTEEKVSPTALNYCGISPKLDILFRSFQAIERRLKLNSDLPYFASQQFRLGYILQVAWDLKKRQCDVIHIHNFSQFVPVARALNPRAKIVLHLHCEWLSDVNREVIAQRLNKADAVIGCSHHITNKIRDRFPEYASICRTIWNGVDITHFTPPPAQQQQERKDNKPPKLLFVGRISPEKGIHDLLKAFAIIVKQYPQAILDIVGPEIVVEREFILDFSDDPKIKALEPFYDGRYGEQLKAMIPPELASQVRFVGPLTQEELLPYYWNADLVVNPSLSEAFGMSLIESMATETPVVATTTGGMPEIVTDKTGLLVEPANEQALAGAILKLLGDQQLRISMGIAGRERVLEFFSWNQIASNLLSCYQQIDYRHESNLSSNLVT
jgi:glycosyltransferase involved in cell wall biosynthesis